jgi:hypothetical protein
MNPSRMVKYLNVCGVGEEMYVIREEVRKRAGEILREQQQPAACAVAPAKL